MATPRRTGLTYGCPKTITKRAISLVASAPAPTQKFQYASVQADHSKRAPVTR
jgi:hypothetical protein